MEIQKRGSQEIVKRNKKGGWHVQTTIAMVVFGVHVQWKRLTIGGAKVGKDREVMRSWRRAHMHGWLPSCKQKGKNGEKGREGGIHQ